AASTCGVGPSTPTTPTLPQTPTVPIPPSTSSDSIPAQAPSAQRPDAGRKRTDKANKASDVYFFIRPLKSPDPPSTLPAASSGEGNIDDPGLLTEKPSAANYPHLGCRLCSKWKIWKNSAGESQPRYEPISLVITLTYIFRRSNA
ncbi:hypothetical protein B0H10DRAFT_1872489, partial [Mycena sp. CBHHK59/15]